MRNLVQTKVNNFEYEWPGGEQDAAFIFKKMKSIGPNYLHISTHKGLEPVWQTENNLSFYAKKYFEDVKANRIDYKYPEYSRKLQALVSAVKSIYPRRSKEELEKLMHGKVSGYNDKRYEFR